MPPGHIGEFEQMVLLAILQVGDDAYGLAIRQELEARTGRKVSHGAAYVTLERRADISNEVQAHLFLSIHADAAENRSAHGFTVYVARAGSKASLQFGQILRTSRWAITRFTEEVML